MTYMPMTVEECKSLADRSRDEGYEGLASIFDGIATKLARFNENSPFTVEELRQQVGDDKFFELLLGKP